MEPAGLTTLPVELIHHISRYLSMQDILSCSSTCHYLRDALNHNFVWKRFLSEGTSNLETQEQQVSTALPRDLSHLCENRRHIVRKTHLLNNWRGGHYTEHTFKNEYNFKGEYIYYRYYLDGHNLGDIFYENKYICIGHAMCEGYDYESDMIEIWDISNVPVLHTTFKVGDINNVLYGITGHNLVVIDVFISRVSVYQINLPEKKFSLKCSFIVTGRNAVFDKQIEYCPNDGKHNDWRHSIVKNYLISCKIGDNLLHIWDVQNGSKLGAYQTTHGCFGAENIYNNDRIFVFELSSTNLPNNYFSTFDIDKLQFTDHKFCFLGEPQVIIWKSNIILFCSAPHLGGEEVDIVGTVYESESGLRLSERHFGDAITNFSQLSRTTTIQNGRFVVPCKDGFHVLDALTLKTVNRFQYDNINRNRPTINMIEKQMSFCESHIVLGCNSRWIGEVELFDINRKMKIPIQFDDEHINDRIYVYLDKHNTKLIILRDKYLKVLHFW